MENLIGALAVAAIGGLSFVAYKHPKDFKRFNSAVLALAMLVMLGVMIFYSGMLAGERWPYNPGSKERTFKDVLFAVLAIAAVAGYGLLLEHLPKLIKLGEEDEKERERESKRPKEVDRDDS